jgi:hypothetical protein
MQQPTTEDNEYTTIHMKLIEPVILEMVIWYNRQSIEWKNTATRLYQNEPVIQVMWDTVYSVWACIQWFVYSIYFRATHLHIEPNGDWLSLVGLFENPQAENIHYRYNFAEKYEYIDSNVDSTTNIEHLTPTSCMDVYYSRALTTIRQDKHVKEILLTLKDADTYLVRTCIDTTMENRPIQTPYKKSNVEFLCIEYRHPKMTSPISITIPQSYFWVGNELLSMAFIQRFLEYQSLFVTYYFDEEYVLNVMDQDIQQYQLTRNNYIVLEEDTLRVVTLSVENTNHFVTNNLSENVEDDDEYADMPDLIDCEEDEMDDDLEEDSPDIEMVDISNNKWRNHYAVLDNMEEDEDMEEDMEETKSQSDCGREKEWEITENIIHGM